MQTRKLIRLLPALVFTCTPDIVASTITLGFDPTVQTVNVGSSAALQLTAADLVDFAPPALGAFDLSVGFSPSIVSVQSVTFGPDLGGSGEAVFSSTVTPGALRLIGISLLSPADLDALQPDSFVIATINMQVNALGTSTFMVTPNSLSDEFGLAITLTKTETGEVTGVPEPGTLELAIVAGVLCLLACRARLLQL